LKFLRRLLEREGGLLPVQKPFFRVETRASWDKKMLYLE
jgi:hypothetical protein